jgi:hypothetical protein
MARGPIPDKSPDRPTVPEVLPLIRELFRREDGFFGGALHCELIDGNLEDWFFRHSMQEARAIGDDLKATIAEAMLAMTTTQRRRLYYARLDGS